MAVTQRVFSRQINTLADLVAAVDVIRQTFPDVRLDEICIESYIQLFERKLTDGSVVFDAEVR